MSCKGHHARFDRIGKFILATEPSRIPVEVCRFASLLLLDTLGVAAAAHAMAPARSGVRACVYSIRLLTERAPKVDLSHSAREPTRPSSIEEEQICASDCSASVFSQQR